MPGRPSPAVYRRRRLAAGLVVVAIGALLATVVTAASRDEPEPADQAAARSARSGATTTTVAPATTTTIRSTGTFVTAPGGSPAVGPGPVQRYRVEVEEGTGVDVEAFAAHVDRILADPRGWTTADGVGLQRVSDGSAELSVRLATPHTTDVLCFPLDTAGEASCGQNAMAVLNLERWQVGADPAKLDLEDYRAYLVTHEFGHLLGHRHVGCPGPGLPAPTMMQQTYSIGDCAPNPWPVIGGG